MPAEPLSQLAQAIKATGQVVDAITPEQWQVQSPCPDWTVAELARHLIAGNFRFATLADGKPRQDAADLAQFDTVLADSGLADAGLAAAYHASGQALLEGFGAPGALERIVTVPIGQLPGIAALHMRVTELLVHGWDLAAATGQRAEFPADLAEAELAFTVSKLGDVPADQRPFAPPQPIADDAPAIERLAACLGRDVAAVRSAD